MQVGAARRARWVEAAVPRSLVSTGSGGSAPAKCGEEDRYDRATDQARRFANGSGPFGASWRPEVTPMLSLNRCRQILGPAVELTEAELERVRDDLYALAQVVVDIATRRRKVRGKKPAAPADEREDRAA